MAAPALAIRRFALAVEARGAGAPDLARRASEAVRERLPAMLAERLPAAAEGPLLMIRRLELDLTVFERDGADEIARRLAEAIVLAVEASIPADCAAEPAGRDAIPRFASRAALTAAFLAALAEGRGLDGWWFRSFDGVRLLAPSAAARTILLRDPPGMAAVFAALDPAARARLAGLLRESDAALLLDALAALPCAQAEDRDWLPLATALRGAAARTPLARALEALMSLAAGPCADIAGGTAAAARAASLLLSASRSDAPRPGGRARRAPDPSGHPLPEALRAALSGRDGPSPASAGAPLFSPLGGYALLLPSLIELDMAAFAKGWPDIGGVEPDAGFSSSSSPRPRATGACSRTPSGAGCSPCRRGSCRPTSPTGSNSVPPAPPPVRDLAAPYRRVALPAGLGSPRVRRAVATLARHTLARFAGRLPGFASASAPFLRTNLLGSGATLSGEAEITHVRLERPPLDVLLSITGAGDRELSFSDGRIVHLERRE